MDSLKSFQENWAWLSSNPWGAITLAVIFSMLVWTVAMFFYSHRIEALKERIDALKDQLGTTDKKNASSMDFSYPQTGRHGKNALANTVHEVNVDEPVSFRAEVPPKSRLHIALEGIMIQKSGDGRGSWHYTVGPINWTGSRYDHQNGGRQSFDAEEGTADMQMTFVRPGEVRITAYENGSNTPAWHKTLRVRDKPAGT